MEEGAIGPARFLTVLDLPVGLIAIVVGLFTAVRLVPRAATQDLPEIGVVERIAVGLCAGVAMLGVLGTIEGVFTRRPDFPPLAVLFAVAIILCGLPAIAWKSRWRGVAEGVATVSIACAAILAGFSIGFLFVPLVILMICVCVLRLRVTRRSRQSQDISAAS
jgi:ribose/xylose/arabinose/galactoside ABC-type transport system permease subunit